MTWSQLGSGQPMNDALLSGSLHIASGGVAPFLILWGRTQGNLNVKAVAALSSMPMYLVTNNPNVKTIRDFTEKIGSRWRVRAPRSRRSCCRWRAAKEFGDANYNKFSTLYRNLSHPDGLAAFLSGRNHGLFFFSAFPVPGARETRRAARLLNSTTSRSRHFLVAWSTGEIPRGESATYGAFVGAWREAVEWINANKRSAAEVYVKESNDKSGVAAIERC